MNTIVNFHPLAWVSALLLLLLGSTPTICQELEFAPPVRLAVNGRAIDAGGFRSPFPSVTDMNNDGIVDLVVSEYNGGKIRIYHNEGGAGKPILKEAVYLQKDGVDMTSPAEGGLSPTFVDLDGDGRTDFISGTDSGLVLWYQRDGNQSFNAPKPLKLSSGELLKLGGNTYCQALDWDGDRDFDLILGCSFGEERTGTVFYIENKGTNRQPAFADPVQFKSVGKAIQFESRDACPFAVDWDRDGRLDLLVGNWLGEVQLFKSSADRAAFDFSEPELLIPRSVGNRMNRNKQIADVVERSRGAHFCVTDWNSDGLLDIIIADETELYAPAAMLDEEGIEELRTLAAHTLEKYRKLRIVPENETPAYTEFRIQSRKQLAQTLAELQSQIADKEKPIQSKAEFHGFIWYFQRLK